jgi:MFS transporter, CP family, cyanate transporter
LLQRSGPPRRESARASAPERDAERNLSHNATVTEARSATQTIRIVAALVLVGTALRPQALIVGPLIGEVQTELGMSHGVAGLLSTIPVLAMGFLAPLGPVLSGSVGPRMGAAICVLFIAVFGVLRALLPDAATILFATVGVGVGMAVIGPILPAIVRQRLPNHPAAGTGAYVAGLVVGATATAILAVPIAQALGGWRASFTLVSAVAFVSLAAWLVLMPRDKAHRRSAPQRPALPWRRPSAWLIGAIFGSQSILFYGGITWLASIYTERGWGPVEAGGLVALFTGIGIIPTLAVPIIADRIGNRRSQLSVASLLSIAGALVVALLPGEPPGSILTVAGVVLLGLGIGAYFPLALTLPVDVAADAGDAASISALMLLIGYLLASAAPVARGFVRDTAGEFAPVTWVLVGVAVAQLPLALSLHPKRLQAAGG